MLPGDLTVMLLAAMLHGDQAKGAWLSAVPWRDGMRRTGLALVTAFTWWSPPPLLQCALNTPIESTSMELTQHSEALQHSGASPGNCDLKDKQKQKMPSETSQEPGQRCRNLWQEHDHCSFHRHTDLTVPWLSSSFSLTTSMKL